MSWLKTRGYIADDKRKCLRLGSYPEQRIKRDKNYRVEVTLDDLTATEAARRGHPRIEVTVTPMIP